MDHEVSSCKTIGTIQVEAATSLPQAEAQLAALQAEGTKIVIQEPEYGPAELPAMQRLVSAGVILVPVLNNPGGSVPTDFSAAVFQNTTTGPAEWAKFFYETIKSGKIAFLGGTPGATSSEAWFRGLQTALKAYPSLHLVNSHFIVTNWNAGDVTSAVAGLLAKYGRIAGIAMDYGVTSTGVITAYQDAHMALPAIATVASGEVNACEWHKDPFPYMTLGGSTYLGALAVKVAVQIENGHKGSVISVNLPTVVDTATGLNPPACDSTVSPDTPMTQVLAPAQRAKAEQAVLSAT
jgi:ribose transport system substrate-binding protein